MWSILHHVRSQRNTPNIIKNGLIILLLKDCLKSPRPQICTQSIDRRSEREIFFENLASSVGVKWSGDLPPDSTHMLTCEHLLSAQSLSPSTLSNSIYDTVSDVVEKQVQCAMEVRFSEWFYSVQQDQMGLIGLRAGSQIWLIRYEGWGGVMRGAENSGGRE